MSDYIGENIFQENIYLVEETDVVIGGPDGTANKSAKLLADRTIWLKNALRGYSGITLKNTSAVLTKTDVLEKLVVIDSNFESIELTLPILEIGDAGLRVSLVAYNVAGQLSIRSAGVNDIIFDSNLKQTLYMGDSDTIDLVWLGDKWIMFNYTGNFMEVGKQEFAYSVKPNTVIANGSILNRLQYPRLWEYAQTIGSSLISDGLWTGTSGYKGFFSSGNGATTFRIPDLRSMFIRGLDLGAGISFARNSSNPGGYEVDEFKAHSHPYEGSNNPGGGGDGTRKNVPSGKDTGSTGGLETRPKNIGLIPLIKI